MTTDLYLEEKEKSGGSFTEEQLAHACMDLFIAGSETTSKSQEVSLPPTPFITYKSFKTTN